MEVASLAAQQLVDAMTTDVLPRTNNPNPLKNKVVHADIRVQSIEDESTHEANLSQNEQLVEKRKPSFHDVEEQERAEEMQTWWNDAMKKHMNQPDGYEKVAVLLIKWADELDELNTRKEAEELDALFRDRFHYQTTTVELNVRKKPQHQLNSYISDFIRDHDGPDNLLIIYYTGHGWWQEKDKFLELSATRSPTRGGFLKDARANWNKAEEKLKDEEVEGDVLTILDTCYSSNLVKSGKEITRKIELLSACAIDQTTAAPGDQSFTRALIDALTALLREQGDRPFSTSRLQQRINIDKRRSDTPAHLWQRSHHTEHHIFLAPLKTAQQQLQRPPSFRYSPGGYLTLRFGLRDALLNQEQIEFMTRTLSNSLNNKAMIGLKEVKWVDMKPAPPIPHFDRVALVIYVVKQWKKVISKKKEERASQRTVDEVTFPEAMDLSPTESLKRTYEADELPEAKRQYLDPSQPPSPPVSTSSRYAL